MVMYVSPKNKGTLVHNHNAFSTLKELSIDLLLCNVAHIQISPNAPPNNVLCLHFVLKDPVKISKLHFVAMSLQPFLIL